MAIIGIIVVMSVIVDFYCKTYRQDHSSDVFIYRITEEEMKHNFSFELVTIICVVDSVPS
jgi:hypothetical protein